LVIFYKHSMAVLNPVHKKPFTVKRTDLSSKILPVTFITQFVGGFIGQIENALMHRVAIPNPIQTKPITVQPVAMNMQLSQQGLIFIQNHEGFGKLVKTGNGKYIHENPYRDSLGNVTAGYGHLIEPKHTQILPADFAKYGDMTEDEALVLLKQDVQLIVPKINGLVKVSLTQYQFDAIVSFTFNVGVGDYAQGEGLAGSKFLEQLNLGKYEGKLMMHFHHPADIIGRRQDEINLFTTGTYTSPPKPSKHPHSYPPTPTSTPMRLP
jgi:GH24 family phage-related lysozyme (muramidase)